MGQSSFWLREKGDLVFLGGKIGEFLPFTSLHYVAVHVLFPLQKKILGRFAASD